MRRLPDTKSRAACALDGRSESARWRGILGQRRGVHRRQRTFYAVCSDGAYLRAAHAIESALVEIALLL